MVKKRLVTVYCKPQHTTRTATAYETIVITKGQGNGAQNNSSPPLLSHGHRLDYAVHHRLDIKANNYNELTIKLHTIEFGIRGRALQGLYKTAFSSVSRQPRLFVLTFVGDMAASAAKTLSDEVTAILLTAKPEDEVLVKLNSPGGAVNGYGLATSQLQRIKDANIRLTIAVDKIAASGGYMMACVADHLLAAPFAIIGSIGVLVQIPNFHKWLQKNDVDYELVTAGDYKRTLTMLGKNTQEGREKVKEEVDTTHELFKQHIARYRPQLDMSRVATGEHWFAVEALELQLVDALQTSDDYLLQKKDTFSIFELRTEQKKSMMKQLLSKGSLLMDVFVHQRGGADYVP